LGYVNTEDLIYFYNKALAFVFPSLYEGFGLPVLEAMACGCPIITTQGSSLLEVGSDAVLYVDSHNIEEIVNQMKKMIKDKDLRENLIKKGLMRAKNYSWEKCAKETMNVLINKF